MRKRFFAGSLAVLAAVSALLAATAGASSKGDQLVGAGSTSSRRSCRSGRRTTRRRRASTSSTRRSGSGAGIAAIQARTVDFGASDAPLTPDQFSNCKGCFQIPWALGGVAVMVHVKTNARAPLKISGPVLAQIFLGTIKTLGRAGDQEAEPRHRPAQRADRAGLPLGRLGHVLRVHRLPLLGQPGRGSRRSASRRSRHSRSAPGARGSSGVLGRRLQDRRAAIGYADIAFAVTNHIPVMAVKNAAGKYHDAGHQVDRGGREGVQEGAGEQRDAHHQPAQGGEEAPIRSAPTRT